MKPYRVILFDADNTLLDFNRSEAEAFIKLLEHYGFAPDPAYIEEYHQINIRCWEAFEEGRMEKSEVLTKRFELFFQNHNRLEDGEEAEEYYRIYLEKGSHVIEGTFPVLDYLREKYALYIVTNGVARTQHIRLRDSGLAPYFKEVFISEEAGSQKPQKEFFDYVFARLPDAKPEEMLLVGDSLTSDMKGGVNAGIDTCWYNPSGTENKQKFPIIMEIRSLNELKEIL